MMHIEANKRFYKSNQMLNVGMDWYEMRMAAEIELEKPSLSDEVTMDNGIRTFL